MPQLRSCSSAVCSLVVSVHGARCTMIPLPAPLHADFTKSNEWSGATSFKVGSMAAQICPFSTHATPSGLHPLPASHDSDAGPRTYPSIIVTCDLLSLLSRPILHVTAAWSLHPAGGTDYKGQAPPCVMPQNRSLHSLAADELNPYQSAMTIIAKTLEPFDEDGLIPAIGFGDGELGEGGDVCSCPSPNVSAFSLAPSLIKAMPSLALHSLHIYTLIFRAPLPPAPSLHPPHTQSRRRIPRSSTSSRLAPRPRASMTSPAATGR